MVDPDPALLAQALEQETKGHGTRFFNEEALASLELRTSGGALQIRCRKRQKWLKAKPEEVVRQLALDWVISELGYSLPRIAVEWGIQMGSDSEKERADIVIFSDDARTDPFIIVETKRPNLTEGLEQLRSYLRWTGCFFGLWTNGDDAVFLLREADPVTAMGPYTFRDIPRLPRFGESLDEVLLPLTPKDLRPIQDLRSLVQRLEHDALANAGVVAFDELFKLFFAKLFDEIRPQSKLSKPCRFRVATADDDILYDRLNGLFEEAKSKPNVKGIFDVGDSLKLRGDALRLCASALEPLTIAHSDLEVIDAAFEYLVNPEQKGQKGQYFTPRPVVRMAVKMLDPQDGEKIIDPACGSGGFLIHSLRHVQAANDWSNAEAYRFANEYLFGVDFDDKLVRVAKMSMIVAGDGKANIFRVNSLDTRAWQNSPAASRIGSFTKDVRDGDFSLVLTNPPFAGKVTGRTQLNAFDLYDLASAGLMSPGEEDDDLPEDPVDDSVAQEDQTQSSGARRRRVTSMKRDILFLERGLDLLQPGGRMAFVLPQGNLNNIGLTGLRDYLLSRARLLAVVGLHFFTFRPFASIKTSVLFVQKWGGVAGERLDDYPVFMAVSAKPGKDNRGRYIYRTDSEGLLLDDEGVPIIRSYRPAAVDSDLEEIADAFIVWADHNQIKLSP